VIPLLLSLATSFQIPQAQPGVTVACSRICYPGKIDDFATGVVMQVCVKLGMNIDRLHQMFGHPEFEDFSTSHSGGTEFDVYLRYGIRVSQDTYRPPHTRASDADQPSPPSSH
jgi:hypothetical protein